MYELYGEVKENVDLKKYNTYGIGGLCKYLIYPYDINKLIDLMALIKKNHEKYFILGNGSNVILPDEYFDGIIIILDKLCNLKIENDYLTVESGVMLPNLNNYLLNLGYVNFYWTASIPGCIGGSIIGNAGAYKHDIFEDLISINVLDENNKLKILVKKDIDYGYRFTNLNNYIILSAIFKLIKGDVSYIKDLMKENQIKRMKSQPLDKKSAGSVFRNPEGYSAGQLIDECGLKGYQIGGAKVSDKHANFIINENNATSNDIIELINYIKDKVKEKENIDLVLEQKIVKW